MEEPISKDEQIAQAQELLSVATRNYYVKAYSDAVDDFSTVCSIFSDVYGPSADELGTPYLMYAKCLVAVGQEENKIMEIPEEQEDEQEEEDDDDEEQEGTSAKDEAKETVAVDSAQPGTSTGITKSSKDAQADEEDVVEDDVPNLQVAWEVLELAAGIFSRSPARSKELAECYIELAGISFENSNFEAAIKDFNQALVVIQDQPERDRRELAEIHYKIGLAHTMLNTFDEAKVSLRKACNYLDEVIAAELEKNSAASVVDDLRETKAEIENKIAEVDDYKEQSLAEVRRELSKLVEQPAESFPATNGVAKTSSKPAADISHLIKRKKPEESATAGEGSSNVEPLVKRKKE